jgi:hypothetical protein
MRGKAAQPPGHIHSIPGVGAGPESSPTLLVSHDADSYSRLGLLPPPAQQKRSAAFRRLLRQVAAQAPPAGAREADGMAHARETLAQAAQAAERAVAALRRPSFKAPADLARPERGSPQGVESTSAAPSAAAAAAAAAAAPFAVAGMMARACGPAQAKAPSLVAESGGGERAGQRRWEAAGGVWPGLQDVGGEATGLRTAPAFDQFPFWTWDLDKVSQPQPLSLQVIPHHCIACSRPGRLSIEPLSALHMHCTHHLQLLSTHLLIFSRIQTHIRTPNACTHPCPPCPLLLLDLPVRSSAYFCTLLLALSLMGELHAVPHASLQALCSNLYFRRS